MIAAAIPRVSPSGFGIADAVLNALPHPVVIVGPDGNIVDANVAAEAFFEVGAPVLRRR